MGTNHHWGAWAGIGATARGFLSAALLFELAANATPASKDSFEFVVLGDNRGDSSGDLSPAFQEVLRAVGEASPRFVLNTGDMIYGHTDLATARQQWQAYIAAIERLRLPVYHVPGNHDIWGASSASLYREMCGSTSFAFDYGPARFIGLDTESHESRLGAEQFGWLKRQLAACGDRQVFVMLHRPLFPADGGVGSSLDVYPAERDELHRLFSQYSRVIEAVFLGHEHCYHYEERDGVRYYITGGAGANLYEPPELGGFHHFLLVHVSPKGVKVQLKRIGAPGVTPGKPCKIASNSLLESWEQGLLWYPWDYTVRAEMTSHHASQGARGLQLGFDLAQCPWPVLSLPLRPAWDLSNTVAVIMDIYLPRTLKGQFTIVPGVETTRKFAAQGSRLRPGWNTVRTEFSGAWLPINNRGTLRAIEWALEAGGSKEKGFLVFDNFRAESRRDGAATSRVLESWEEKLLWRVADESVIAGPEEHLSTEGTRGLRLTYDFSNCPRPILLARLNPPWDLSRPEAITLDVFVPNDASGEVSLGLALRAEEVSRVAPPVPLHRGWNKVRVDLNEAWLPKNVRAAAEQVEWRIYSNSASAQGWLVFDNMRTEGR